MEHPKESSNISQVFLRVLLESMNSVFSFLVSGLGFGIMSGLFAMVNVLADITGPGTIGLYGDYNNFFIVTGTINSHFSNVNSL